MPSPGETVAYRALAGEIHPAVVTAVRSDGLLDLDVQLRGVKEPFPRTRVPWHDAPVAARGVAFPSVPA